MCFLKNVNKIESFYSYESKYFTNTLWHLRSCWIRFFKLQELMYAGKSLVCSHPPQAYPLKLSHGDCVKFILGKTFKQKNKTEHKHRVR